MRNMVVCLDGTWNRPDQRDRGRQVPSNVVKIARAVDRTKTTKIAQHVYYDTGVGTGGLLDRVVGGATGRGISENIREAYRWLIENYQAGDRLYLFGFSRGAYSARSLAGLIGVCGIRRVDGCCPVRVAKEAYAIYRDKNRQGQRGRSAPVARETEQAVVHFVGVWDTVGALGVPTRGPLGWWTRKRSGFHDVGLGGHIEHAYHALAINESRGPFKPVVWTTDPAKGQVVIQAWFPGVHSNVGGGYVDSGLSDRALLWMIYNASQHGLRFDENYIDLCLRPNWFGELRDSMSPWYRLVPWNRPRERNVGLVSCTTERLHVSVSKRWCDITSPDKATQRVAKAMDSMAFVGSEWETEFNLGNRKPLVAHSEESAVNIPGP